MSLKSLRKSSFACVLGLALALLAALRLERRIRAGAVRSPWIGLQDIPADQILY